MARFKATNSTTGEEVSFEWSAPRPPSPNDVDRIADQQRTSRMAAKEKIGKLETPSTIESILTSPITGAISKGADWLGLNQPQFLHPMENLSNIAEGTKQMVGGGGSEANPRTAGVNKIVKGAMGIGGLPLTALGYAVNPVGTAAGMIAGHATAAGTGVVIPADTSPEVKELSQNAAGLLAGGVAGHYASRFTAPTVQTPQTPPSPSSTAVGYPWYGRSQPNPPRGATITNMGPRQLGPVTPPPMSTGTLPPPTVIPFTPEAITPEVLPPYQYSAGRPTIEPGQTPTQLPARGEPIVMPPASIPQPAAGTYGRQQISEQAFGPGVQPQISARPPIAPPLSLKPEAPSEVPTVPTPVPEPKAPEVRSQAEQTPERQVVQNIDRNETLKPEVASTLAVGSTRINSKGGVETLQEVPIDKIDPTPGNELYPQGNKIYPEKVQQYIDNPSPVAVELRARPNGRFETYEGHHRIEADKAQGKTTALAWTSETGPDNLPLPAPPVKPAQASPEAAQAPSEPQVKSPTDIARVAIARSTVQPPPVAPKSTPVQAPVQATEPQVKPPTEIYQPSGQIPEGIHPNEVVDFIKEQGNVSPTDIRDEFSLSPKQANEMMQGLKKRGLVEVKKGRFVVAESTAATSPTEPVVKPPENIRPEPSALPQVRPPLMGKQTPPESPAAPVKPTISAKPAISNEKPTTSQEGDLMSRLEKGTSKQQAMAGEAKTITKRLDEIENKEDTKEGITDEETTERNSLYRKLADLEKKGEHSLKPDIEKYGPRVANMRSLHADFPHDVISARAKTEFGVKSTADLTPEQLSQLGEMLKTDKMEAEVETAKPKGVFDETNTRIDELESKEETQKLSDDEEVELKNLYRKLSKLEKQRGSISFRPLGKRRPTNEPSRFGTFLHKFNGIINSQDVFLEQNPQTRPVAEIIHNAQIRGDHFEYFWSRRYNSAPDKQFVREQLANFVESRGLGMEDIKPTTRSGNEGFRDFLHNIKTEVYDKPAAARARDVIKDLEKGFDKDRAEWYVNNWMKADLRSEGHRFFKQLDSAAASIGARSVLFGSTDLQLLHTARLASQVWPEVGTADTLGGLANFIKDPAAAWREAAAGGLMPQQKVPWGLKSKTEKLDSVGNFLDFGNSIVKVITLQAMKTKYPDDISKAVRETKRVEGVVGRESPIYALEKTPKTVYQFKYWLFKYLGGFGTAIQKGEMAKVARYITAAVMLEEMTKKLGIRLYHLKASTMFSGGSPTLRKAQNIVTHTSKGQFGKVGKDIATTLPGGQSLLPTAQKLLNGDFRGAFKEFLP